MSTSRNPQPPKIATWLFNWWASQADTEDLKGDLDEDFEQHVQTWGLFRAQVRYFRQVISLCFSYSLRRRKEAAAFSPYYPQASFSMVHSYFKIALRTFSKQKLFTSINILGLALGMSICLLALAVSTSILRSDHFHDKKDRIVQINTDVQNANGRRLYAATFPEVGNHLAEKYPFVETKLSIRKGFQPLVKHHGNTLSFHGYFVDPTFFEVLSFQLLKGNPATALAAPNTLVLTATVAEKLFRDADPIGKVLETESGSFTVTGVMPDLKETHLHFQVLTSTLTHSQFATNTNGISGWQDFQGHYLYLLLRPGTSGQTLQAALHQTSEKLLTYNPDQKIALSSVALDEVVPRWDISQALGIGWDYPSMLFFLFVGLLILLPAIFNYVNLSIAQAMKRAREIGIRKVVGAGKTQVKMQLIVETVLLTFLALIGSVCIFTLIRKEFLDMVVAAEVLDVTLRPILMVVFVLFALVIGIAAGIFPALYFSQLNPIHTLKGHIKQGKLSISGVKKGLFVFQFALSLFFIIGVTTMIRQYRHVFSHGHAFVHEQVLSIVFHDQNKAIALHELASHPDVQSVTTASHLPGLPVTHTVPVLPNEKDTLLAVEVFIGDHFISQFQMEWVWGTEPNWNASTQNEEMVLVNEQFLRSIGVFQRTGDTLNFTLGDGRRARIAGVLKNVHYEPLSEEIRPMVFRHSLDNSHYALVQVSSEDMQETVAELEAIWSRVDQKVPFEASFLDEEIERAYRFLTVQIKMFGFLGAMAIIISSLGLLGMVAYTTENRTKEIAIRKIMGASVTGIYMLLTRDFARLIGISALLAIPLSYVFYDRIFLYLLVKYGLGLGVLEVVVSVMLLFVIGFLLIYWQTSKIAHSNPANNLRYE